ncbi:MAG: type II secretion system F family protein [Sulfuricellaceae bacterium]|nr:type II secretion system F family protein [Sulfuricellaceae bacterium]
MPNFSYKGRNSRGELMQGFLEGSDSSVVADQLLNMDIIPIDIAIASQGATRKAKGVGAMFNQSRKIEPLDIMLFSRQMYTMLKAGVPIMRALNGMRQSARNPALAAVLQELSNSLDRGMELSDAMRPYPKLFSEFYVSMVKVGEMTGQLDQVFLRLFNHLEFEKKMRDQIKSALRYPSFVVLAMAAAMTILNIFVIPIFAKVFKGFGAELPPMTRLLIGMSNFTVQYWWAMAAVLGTVVAAFISYVRTTEGRYRWDKFKLRLPIAGKIIFKATMARFARSFALAGKSGVPIVQAFEIVAKVVENSFIAQRVGQMREGVSRGESVLRTAIAAEIFSPLELQMIAIGEETGELDNLMEEVARMYESDVEYDVSKLSQQIEPIMMSVLAVMVLILALGIFLPMWDLGSAALHKK